jgi:hypothetical protein
VRVSSSPRAPCTGASHRSESTKPRPLAPRLPPAWCAVCRACLFRWHSAESGGAPPAVQTTGTPAHPPAGLGLALEQRRDGLQRDLRGHFALRVPAHAVGQHKQARLARVAVAHAVFVLLAPAAAADLEYRKLHSDSRKQGCAKASSMTMQLARTRFAWVVLIWAWLRCRWLHPPFARFSWCRTPGCRAAGASFRPPRAWCSGARPRG